MPLSVPSDIEIANSVKPRPIVDVAADLGLTPDDIELYGRYKAKISLGAIDLDQYFAMQAAFDPHEVWEKVAWAEDTARRARAGNGMAEVTS